MKRRRYWLPLVACLALGAAWLGRRELRYAARRSHPEAEFPVSMDDAARARQRAREVGGRDPFLAALPPVGAGGAPMALVVEAAVIAPTAAGDILMRCMRRGGAEERMRQQTGFGLESVDRVAFSDELAALEGHFGGAVGARLREAFQADGQASHGARAVIHTRSNAEGEPQALASWDERILLNGKLSVVLAALDRMEGADAGLPAVPEESAYGDAYGSLAAGTAADFLRDKLADVSAGLGRASRIDLHLRTKGTSRGDVLVVVDVTVPEAGARAELLGKLGNALLLGRGAARARSDENAVAVADSARVSPVGDALRLEAALPIESIAHWLSHCADTGPK